MFLVTFNFLKHVKIQHTEMLKLDYMDYWVKIYSEHNSMYLNSS